MMLGQQEMTSGGIFYFKPSECQYCRLDTGGNHQWNCPCVKYSEKINNNLIIKGGHPLSYNFRSLVETIS